METSDLITVNKTTLDKFLSEFDESQSIEIQEYALGILGQYIFDAGRVREWTKLFEAEILYKLKKLWQSGIIRPEIISLYDGFHGWAMKQQYTKIQGQSRASIDNKIRVHRSWKSPEAIIKPPPTVFLKTGKIDEYGEEELKETPFVADSYTKMLRAVVAGEEGDLGDECWAAITDPTQTVEDVGRAIKASRNGANSTPTPPEDDKVVVFGGCLRIVSNGNYTPFAQWTNIDDPIASRGRRTVLAMLGLKDEPFTIDVDYSATVEFVDGGMIWDRGNGQVLNLSNDEMRNLYEQLKGGYENEH